MNGLTFRQWLNSLPGETRKLVKVVVENPGVGQIIGGCAASVVGTVFLWSVLTPHWLSAVIFITIGMFLILRGIWNCDKEDERDRRARANR